MGVEPAHLGAWESFGDAAGRARAIAWGFVATAGQPPSVFTWSGSSSSQMMWSVGQSPSAQNSTSLIAPLGWKASRLTLGHALAWLPPQ